MPGPTPVVDTMNDSELGPSQREVIRQVGYQHMMGSAMEGGEGGYGIDMTDGRNPRGRKENGLVELTKKFIDLLKEAENQTLGQIRRRGQD